MKVGVVTLLVHHFMATHGRLTIHVQISRGSTTVHLLVLQTKLYNPQRASSLPNIISLQYQNWFFFDMWW